MIDATILSNFWYDELIVNLTSTLISDKYCEITITFANSEKCRTISWNMKTLQQSGTIVSCGPSLTLVLKTLQIYVFHLKYELNSENNPRKLFSVKCVQTFEKVTFPYNDFILWKIYVGITCGLTLIILCGISVWILRYGYFPKQSKTNAKAPQKSDPNVELLTPHWIFKEPDEIYARPPMPLPRSAPTLDRISSSSYVSMSRIESHKSEPEYVNTKIEMELEPVHDHVCTTSPNPFPNTN